MGICLLRGKGDSLVAYYIVATPLFPFPRLFCVSPLIMLELEVISVSVSLGLNRPREKLFKINVGPIPPIGVGLTYSPNRRRVQTD